MYAKSWKTKLAIVQRPASLLYLPGHFALVEVSGNSNWNTFEAAQWKVGEAGRPDQPQTLPFADPLPTWRTACFYSKPL